MSSFSYRAMTFAAAAVLICACAPDSGSEEGPSRDIETAEQGLIALRSASGASQAATTKLTLAKPQGVLANDYLLVRITSRHTTKPSFNAPAGWTKIRSSASSPEMKSWVYGKVATSSEPDSYVFDTDSASAMSGILLAFSGVDVTNPVDTSSGGVYANISRLPSPSLTTATDNAVGVWFTARIHDASKCPAEVTFPAGSTNRQEQCLASETQGLLSAAATKSFGAAGLQTALEGAFSQPATSIGQAVALRAAGAKPPAGGCVVAGAYETSIGTFARFPRTSVPTLEEPSGLAASRRNPGLLWTHNENNKLLFALNEAGLYKTFSFEMPTSAFQDWEDIAVGPCAPDDATSCIWAGDIGQYAGADYDSSKKSTFYLHRAPEPDAAALGNGGKVAVTGTFPFTIPNWSSSTHEAESLMVHPRTGDLYVLTKSTGKTGPGEVRVYKYPMPLSASSKELKLIATMHLPEHPTDPNFPKATAADIHPCAERFLLRTYRAVYEFRATGAFETAFSTEKMVTLTGALEAQGESIAYRADGAGYYTLSEVELKGERIVNFVQAKK